jgi:hypothetical protein
MSQANRSGGPKTVQGKARSSKNATSHGLTSLAPSNPNEKALVDSYTQELTNYYKPDPLGAVANSTHCHVPREVSLFI